MQMNFQGSTIFIIIGIAIVIALVAIIVNQSRILDAIMNLNVNVKAQDEIKPEISEYPVTSKAEKGRTTGQARIVGGADEEIIAVIMAAVSSVSNMPLSSFKITSIKKI
jgi:hypothetical protein